MSPQGGPNSSGGGPNHPQSPSGPNAGRWQDGNMNFGNPGQQQGGFNGMQNNTANNGGFGRGAGGNQNWQGNNSASGFTGNSEGFNGYPQ